MNYLNGGYVMLDKADSDIFAKASGALQAGKPILWYEDKNTCYFIDTIEKTGSDSIALTKGGLTIVITSGNVVTEVGNIKPIDPVILDFTSYNLEHDISSASDIADSNEITKEVFDEIQAKFKDAQDNFKILAVKVTALYDDVDTNGLVIANDIINSNGNFSSLSYYDFANNNMKEITAYKYSDKYYVSVTSTGWYR